jgi:hypothetical protein
MTNKLRNDIYSILDSNLEITTDVANPCYCTAAVIDGGASNGELPQLVFGLSAISRTSVPPSARSLIHF